MTITPSMSIPASLYCIILKDHCKVLPTHQPSRHGDADMYNFLKRNYMRWYKTVVPRVGFSDAQWWAWIEWHIRMLMNSCPDVAAVPFRVNITGNFGLNAYLLSFQITLKETLKNNLKSLERICSKRMTYTFTYAVYQNRKYSVV